MKNTEVLACVLALALVLYAAGVVAGECQDHNWDHWKVAKSLQQGLSKETLLEHLEGSRHELTPERMARIRALIDEVYELPQGGGTGLVRTASPGLRRGG